MKPNYSDNMDSPTAICQAFDPPTESLSFYPRLKTLAVGRHNNLNAVRLGLALMVVFCHSFSAIDEKSDLFLKVTKNQQPLGPFAVDMFFLISGMLITASWLNSRSMNDYLRRRVLRIYPGYLLAIAFSLIVALAFAPNRMEGVREGLHKIKDVATLGYSCVEGSWVFPNNPYPHSANRALWTIAREFYCYIVVAAIGLFGLFKFRKSLLLMFLAVFAYYALCVAKGGTDWVIQDKRFLTFFFAGMCAWLWRDKIIINGFAACACVLLLAMGARVNPLWPIVTPILAGYIVLWLGYAKPSNLLSWTESADLSYGTYLFGFPIQQTLIALGVLNSWALFAVSTPIILGVALASWKVIEKPFLALKSKPFTDCDTAKISASNF